MVYIRRLVKAGPASHTVSLPKEWLEKNNLKRGDAVYVHERGTAELLITPKLLTEPAQEKKAITISADNKALDSLQREITAAYVNNYSTIELVGESIQERQKDIRKILHDFVALEIAEQGPKRVIAKDFLNLKEVTVEATLKRADMIVRTMLNDTVESLKGKDLAQSVAYRDYDVNRIYFLLTRLFKNSLQNKQFSEALGLDGPGVLRHWMFLTSIENAADSIKHLCTAKKKSKELIALVTALSRDYEDVMKAYHANDKQLADNVALRREEREQSCTALAEAHADLIAPAEHCRHVLNNINAIARLVIDG